jgi:hypothetical protein
MHVHENAHIWYALLVHGLILMLSQGFELVPSPEDDKPNNHERDRMGWSGLDLYGSGYVIYI